MKNFVKANYSDYLRSFTYEERKRMKIQISELLKLLVKNEIQFVDIRFREEYEAWHFMFTIYVPLIELPGRLGELDKSKLVVTACPLYDSAIMTRIFLVENGFKARYLTNGLLGLADFLRSDNACEIMNFLNYKKVSND